MQVGVGTSSAKEVVTSVQKAAMDAKRHVVQFPLTKGNSFPHRVDGIAGGAKVMLRPASEGTGGFSPALALFLCPIAQNESFVAVTGVGL